MCKFSDSLSKKLGFSSNQERRNFVNDDTFLSEGLAPYIRRDLLKPGLFLFFSALLAQLDVRNIDRHKKWFSIDLESEIELSRSSGTVREAARTPSALPSRSWTRNCPSIGRPDGQSGILLSSLSLFVPLLFTPL
jgi:hypothetical protein